jgi:hypothetical protein
MRLGDWWRIIEIYCDYKIQPHRHIGHNSISNVFYVPYVVQKKVYE